jgi:hypothetical protein
MGLGWVALYSIVGGVDDSSIVDFFYVRVIGIEEG